MEEFNVNNIVENNPNISDLDLRKQLFDLINIDNIDMMEVGYETAWSIQNYILETEGFNKLNIGERNFSLHPFGNVEMRIKLELYDEIYLYGNNELIKSILVIDNTGKILL